MSRTFNKYETVVLKPYNALLFLMPNKSRYDTIANEKQIISELGEYACRFYGDSSAYSTHIIDKNVIVSQKSTQEQFTDRSYVDSSGRMTINSDGIIFMNNRGHVTSNSYDRQWWQDDNYREWLAHRIDYRNG